jgi:hypothetical protein
MARVTPHAHDSVIPGDLISKEEDVVRDDVAEQPGAVGDHQQSCRAGLGDDLESAHHEGHGESRPSANVGHDAGPVWG